MLLLPSRQSTAQIPCDLSSVKMRADTKVSCLVQILRRSQYAWHSRHGSLRSSACWNETRIILICSPKLCEERNCYRTFASSSAACMPTHYSHPEFLHTSGTIEFILDFSTGLVTARGSTLRIATGKDLEGRHCHSHARQRL